MPVALYAHRPDRNCHAVLLREDPLGNVLICRMGAVVVPALAIPGFSSYDFEVVSEQQIQEWADEAEAGYDVEELRRRGRGRPGRGAAPMQVVAVRLTAEELDALDAAAEKHHMSRSEAIRAALAQLSA